MEKVRVAIEKYGTLGEDNEPIGHPDATCRFQPVLPDHGQPDDAFAVKGHFMRVRRHMGPTPTTNAPTSSSSSSSTSSNSTTAVAEAVAAEKKAADERRRAAARALLDEGEEELEIVSADVAETRFIAHQPSTPGVIAALAADAQDAAHIRAAILSSTSNSKLQPVVATSLLRTDWFFGFTCAVRSIGTNSYSLSLTCIPLPHAPTDEDDTQAKRRFTSFAHWLHAQVKPVL
jgi:hypothetical protein